MILFFKALAGMMIAVIFCLIIEKSNKDYAILLLLAVCCMALIATVSYLKPVMTFILKLRRMAALDNDMLSILVKAVGVGVLSEVAGMICADAGYSAAGKVVTMISGIVILWLSIPLFESLLDLVESLLGSI